MPNKLEEFEKQQLKKQMPEFNIGDTVDVHVRILEGDKERIQIFTGTVIARKGARNRETFTVRRIVAGEGVERVFPIHSPWIDSVKVRRSGKTRRAKLYYLRDRVGKATKVRERMSFEKTHGRKHREGLPSAEADGAESDGAGENETRNNAPADEPVGAADTK